jgi:WD40 repeat protein
MAVPPVPSAGGGRAVDFDVFGVSVLSLNPAGVDDEGTFTDPPIDLIPRGGENPVSVTTTIDPARRWLAATTARDGTRLWNLDDPSPEAIRLAAPEAPAIPVFSSDGHWLAAVGVDGTIRVWDLHGFNPEIPDVTIGNPQEPAVKEPVSGLAVGPGGHSFALSDRYGTVHLFHREPGGKTALPVAVLPGHSSSVSVPPAATLAVSRDGSYVFSVVEDSLAISTVSAVDIMTTVAPRAAGRNLSEEEWERLFPTTYKYERTFEVLPAPLRETSPRVVLPAH